MSLHHLLGTVIRKTFLKEVGKWQSNKEEPKAMLLSFCIPTHEGEEGYRDLDVLIYGPMNYVGVYTRERWDVIPVEDLGDDDEGPKPGKRYTKGESTWKRVCYHDSCWSDAIETLLRKEDLLTWGHKIGDEWYAIVPVDKFQLPQQ